MKNSTPERFEAIRPARCDACIIIRFETALSYGTTQMSHALASGERLRPTDDALTFETLDGKRVFRFRQPTPSVGMVVRTVASRQRRRRLIGFRRASTARAASGWRGVRIPRICTLV